VSAVLGIARHEVRERRFLLVAAASLSLLAWTLHVAPGPAWARALREILTPVLFMAFPTSVALAVGSSLIGRDLAEGRLSFYLSRPVSSGALWAGKFLGGAVLVLGAFFCCLIPFESAMGGSLARDATAGWVVSLLGLMAFAHVTTAMYRSGSWLFALDLCLGALFASVFGAQLRHLVNAGAGHLLFAFELFEPFGGVIGVAISVATAGMLAAAAAQLAYGRADRHRGHVALSTVVWTLALASLGVLALWSAWVLRVTPPGVGGVGYPLFAGPRGSALLFHGASWHGRAGFSPMFLMDGQSGSYVRLPLERVTPPAFATDGRTAVWVAPKVSWSNYLAPYHYLTATRAAWQATAVAPITYEGAGVVVARLDGRAPAVEERPLDLPDAVSMALAVDGDGRQLLLSGRSSVLLLDIASGKLLASAGLSHVVAAQFLPDGVRLYRLEPAARPRATFVVLDWNPKDGSQVEKARVPGEVRMMLLARHGDLAVVSTGAREKAVLDAASGAVRLFQSATSDFPGAALVLSTGQVVLSLDDAVRVVTRSGEAVAALPIGPGSKVTRFASPRRVSWPSASGLYPWTKGARSSSTPGRASCAARKRGYSPPARARTMQGCCRPPSPVRSPRASSPTSMARSSPSSPTAGGA